MNHTPEQLAIISHIRENDGYTLINAVAGAGKTTLLTSIAKTLSPSSALYLAYNRSIANEASRKFPSSVACSTIHSFAYRATIPHYKLRLGNFTYRDLPSYIDYDRRCELLEILKGFFLSDELHFSDYATDLNDTEYKLLSAAILNMENGSIECTHEFYLKYFHILLASGNLTYNNFDFIAVDEAGDINPVTLAIVKLLPATKKILVGDSRQNIYSFNHTINCFDYMQDTGTSFPMSQSFRVSPSIAKDIQQFCTTYIDPQMQFHGTKQTKKITTRAFIARTNSALIDKMMDLNELGIPYTLTRSANDIFKLPRILCSLRKGGFVSTPEFKSLQTDVDHYYDDKDLRHKHKTVLGYLKHIYQNDIQISLAINLILKYRVSGILACYEEAKKHEKLKTSYYLGTAHSTKGLTTH